MIAQMFKGIAELAIPTGIPTNKANAELKNNHWQQKCKKGKFESNLKPWKPFMLFTHEIIALFPLKDSFLFNFF